MIEQGEFCCVKQENAPCNRLETYSASFSGDFDFGVIETADTSEQSIIT